MIENNIVEEIKTMTIDDVSAYFRKIKFLGDKQEELKAQAQREIERINSWLESEIKPLEDKKAYYEGEILRYYSEQRAINPKVKVTTPYGKVAVRKSTKWIYEDEQEIMDYCNMNEIDCIRVKEELDKTALKKLFKDGVNQKTGEVIPGIRIEEVETISLK